MTNPKIVSSLVNLVRGGQNGADKELFRAGVAAAAALGNSAARFTDSGLLMREAEPSIVHELVVLANTNSTNTLAGGCVVLMIIMLCG